MTYYLAVDIGASSGRHILAHLENGKMVTEEIYRFANGPKTTDAGGTRVLRWDAEGLFTEILAGLKRAGELGCAPAYVGIDTWGVDYVLLDERDEPIDAPFCYRDDRTLSSSRLFHEKMPFAELFAKTGIMYNSFNTVYQLFDDVGRGRAAKAKTFLMLPDYFHFRLTGVKAHEYTNATTTGMVNAKTHTWDPDILTALGLSASLFGELTMPGTVLGDFCDSVAQAVGYRAKVVLPSTHDTASAVIAAPLRGEEPYISSGTWSLLGVEQDAAYTVLSAADNGYSNEGAFGYRFRLQKNIMGLWMIQQIRHETGDAYDFRTLEKMARENPVSERVNVNDARFLAPVSMTEEVRAAVGRDLSLGELLNCVYNSLAENYGESLAALEKLTGNAYDCLHIIGGGSRDGYLNELTAKATKKAIVTGPTEATAIGNLLMQMIGTGAVSSLSEGREIVFRSFGIGTL